MIKWTLQALEFHEVTFGMCGCDRHSRHEGDALTLFDDIEDDPGRRW
jgi:hypothetical protein